MSRLNGRPTELLPFDEVRHYLKLGTGVERGVQDVPLDKIVGSLGRYRDFTRAFFPKRDQDSDRWRQVHAYGNELGFPPVDLYQVGAVYFVKDGNHRVSIARVHKAKTIEAYVTEYQTNVPLDEGDDLKSVILKAHQTEFLTKTELDQLRSDQNVRFTEPGYYALVLEHIDFHRQLKEQELGEFSYADAVTSWYDTVYLPLVELVRRRHILMQFPERTEADLYAWLTLHRAELEKEAHVLSHIPDAVILSDLATQNGTLLEKLIRNLTQFTQKRDLTLEMERADFLTITQLDPLCPDHGVLFTEHGSYELVKEHINFHQYLKGVEKERAVPYLEAVQSWYELVYLPVVRLVRLSGILESYPAKTEGDLYILVVLRRATYEQAQQHLGDVDDVAILEELKATTPPVSPLTRFATYLRRMLSG